MKYKSVNDPACDGCVPRAQARQRRAGGGGGAAGRVEPQLPSADRNASSHGEQLVGVSTSTQKGISAGVLSGYE